MQNSLSETLFKDEFFWRDRYHFFKSKGYTLRPRYHPKWQASWKFESNPILELYEDSIIQWKGALLDATAEGEEGKHVFIKRAHSTTHPNEVKIASRLGSFDDRQDKTNHCVPVLAVFSDDRDCKYQYIVMPVLRPFNDPNFLFPGSRQFHGSDPRGSSSRLFNPRSAPHDVPKGLVYMHSQNVAHRDCAAENIMMDGSNLYKTGWHPMNPWQARDGGDLCLSRKRSEVEIRYYFIDFGLSTEFAPDQHVRLVTGQKGRIEAPEQDSELPYEPFKLDVYYLGYVYQTKIVDILGDLARLMTMQDPKDRPSAQETLMLWNGLRSLPSIPPRWIRLRRRQEEGSIERMMNNALDVVGMVRSSLLS